MLDSLNQQQRKAVQAVKGRVLILAGAGSGKTKVLTVRMAHLIHDLNVPPQAILGLTFTNKAAGEMRNRLAQLIEPSLAKKVTLSTFHSFCMLVLRSEIDKLGYTTNFTLYDEYDVGRLVRMIARDELNVEGEIPSLAPTMQAIAHARNRGIAGTDITATGSEWHDSFSQTIYGRLKESMRAYNAVDFDGLLALTVELFETHPEVLDKYQERYRYIMIDEYQDTNPIQYRLASLLAQKYSNLCVVGDDDQSIYGWRGADVHHILEFEADATIKLEQNYRSTNAILRSANALIGNNRKRHGKSLWSNKMDDKLVEVFFAPTEVEESQAVAYRLDQMRQSRGLRWKDMAILYRSNALSRPFEMALMRYTWKEGDKWHQGIPYQICGGTEFYERKEVKDLFAYLRILVNPRDEEALLRIINQPRRGIGEQTLNLLTAHNRSYQVPLMQVIDDLLAERTLFSGLCDRALQGLRLFKAQLGRARDNFSCMPLHEAMQKFVDDIEYKKAIHEEVKSQQMRDFKIQNVQEFIGSMTSFKASVDEGLESNFSRLEEFVAHLPLNQKDWDRGTAKNGENCVKLMTFHSAKGLEFPACFLVCCEDHIIPHEKSLKETGIEEERRLMYVAMTRAMDVLTISMAQKRMRMGKEAMSQPSRFLFEIPKELLQMTSWKAT